jgi:hypothetical protein
MKQLKTLLPLLAILLLLGACKKDNDSKEDAPIRRYFEIGMRNPSVDWKWQDTSFVVVTSDPDVLTAVDAELSKPADQRRKLITGPLAEGNGGYNRNAGHNFTWHLKEDEWKLTDMTIELIDGLPHTDLDLNHDYWMNTVKSFGPWSSYIKKEVTPRAL